MYVCVGTKACARDGLKMSASTSASSDEQTLRARPEMLSGLGAFRGFVLLRTVRTSADVTVSGESCVRSVVTIPLCWFVLSASKRA